MRLERPLLYLNFHACSHHSVGFCAVLRVRLLGIPVHHLLDDAGGYHQGSAAEPLPATDWMYSCCSPRQPRTLPAPHRQEARREFAPESAADDTGNRVAGRAEAVVFQRASRHIAADDHLNDELSNIHLEPPRSC